MNRSFHQALRTGPARMKGSSVALRTSRPSVIHAQRAPLHTTLPTRFPPSNPLLSPAAAFTDSSSSSTSAEPGPLEAACWSCSADLASQPVSRASTCSTCLAIQPVVRSTNLFELFGMDKNGTFDLDEGSLRREFLLRSKEVHPDGFKGKGEIEYQFAQQQSSLLNKAYETLKTPLSRAQYILSLSDIRVQEADAITDQALLMEIMEAREALEDAESEEEVDAIREENREKAKRTTEQLSEAFMKGDLPRAKDLTIELRYWRNVDDAVSNKLHPVD
ncbi:Mitochondrial J-type chaperone [Phaffia rhodozyma]|uniref:Mitochondrial J-type chaperone n=1 Tax=Phaffia rhodozyma TaxID=264483 RepID=A0A0F7SV72_PHARH|nr:Mitochondrial J-type chaperone [Phaffia rhodozyma]